MKTTCRSCETVITLETRRGGLILGQRCPECGERVDSGKLSRRSFFGAAFGAVAAAVAAPSLADSIGPESFRHRLYYDPWTPPRHLYRIPVKLTPTGLYENVWVDPTSTPRPDLVEVLDHHIARAKDVLQEGGAWDTLPLPRGDHES